MNICIQKYLRVPATLMAGLIFVLSAACSEPEQTGPPPNVLTGEDFTALLVDLALAESALALNILTVKPAAFDSVYAFDPFSQHGVSRGSYDSTIRYYAAHPEKYKEICREVLNRLSVLEAGTKGVKTDSVVKIRNVLSRF